VSIEPMHHRKLRFLEQPLRSGWLGIFPPSSCSCIDVFPQLRRRVPRWEGPTMDGGGQGIDSAAHPKPDSAAHPKPDERRLMGSLSLRYQEDVDAETGTERPAEAGCAALRLLALRCAITRMRVKKSTSWTDPKATQR